MQRPPQADFFIPFQAAYALLQDAAERDRTTARRTALTEILWHERYLGRDSLMSRVGDRLGGGCFGDSAWEDTFNRDMQAVKEAFARASFGLGFSRTKLQTGYYLRGEERIHADIRQAIAHSISEMDLRQLGIYRSLGLVQRVRQGLKASEQLRWEARYKRGIKPSGAADMTPGQFIRSLVSALNTAGIVYAFCGTAAGWAWGEPRPAQQFDLIFNLRSGQTAELAEHLRRMGLILGDELPCAVPLGLRRLMRIEAVHPNSDLRVNLIIPPADDELFNEAMRLAVLLDYGREISSLYVLSAEYLVLQSLSDYSIGRDVSDLRLIAAVMFHQGDHLDRAKIGMLAEKKGWQRIWEEITIQADKR